MIPTLLRGALSRQQGAINSKSFLRLTKPTGAEAREIDYKTRAAPAESTGRA
jgi:hypothetical protein